jgi:adenosylcobinamide kinase / adenosylcobinamide-phosphate guanylyltransferase
MRELILGGQKSGKSRLAERRARAWLAQSSSHRAVLIATGLAHDAEMAARIARHQADRRASVPELMCVEEAQQIGASLAQHTDAQTLVIVDCLTLWLTQLLMPLDSAPAADIDMQNQPVAQQICAPTAIELIASLRETLAQAQGPVVLVSNEIGLGVIPLGPQVRAFVDELGKLNQTLAAHCERVTLMVAGCELRVKGQP